MIGWRQYHIPYYFHYYPIPSLLYLLIVGFIYALYPHCIPILSPSYPYHIPIISVLSNLFCANHRDLTATALESCVARWMIPKQSNFSGWLDTIIHPDTFPLKCLRLQVSWIYYHLVIFQVGGICSDMYVSWDGGTPKIIHFWWIFPHKPSILGYSLLH